MARSRPRRTRWSVLRGSLGAGALLGLLGVLFALLQGLRGSDLSWSADLNAATEMPRELLVPAAGNDATYGGQVDVTVAHPDRALSFLAVLPDLLLSLTIAYVCLVLFVLVLRIQEGRAFVGNGPGLLRSVAAVIAIAGIAVPVAHAWANTEILRQSGRLGSALGGGPAEGGWDLNAPLVWLVAAGLVLAVSHVGRGTAAGPRQRRPRLMPVDEPHRVHCRLDVLLEGAR